MHLTLAFFLITFKSPYTACLPGLDNASWLIRRSGERWKVRRSWIDMQVGKYGRWSSMAGSECCGEREKETICFQQLLDESSVISRIIKVKVGVISWSWHEYPIKSCTAPMVKMAEYWPRSLCAFVFLDWNVAVVHEHGKKIILYWQLH